MGKLSEFQAFILSILKSTTFICICGHFMAITAQLGPPTYPAPMQQMFLTLSKKFSDIFLNIFDTNLLFLKKKNEEKNVLIFNMEN